MSMVNKAAWLPEKGARLKVCDAESYKPGPGELLIKNRALGMNPVDFKMVDYGFAIENYPTILGCDLAGEVVEVGEGVTNFKAGQRVLAHPLGLETKKISGGMCRYVCQGGILQDGLHVAGAFQNYAIVLAAATCLLPDNMSFEAGASLPLSVSTAASGLYQKDQLNLRLPSKDPKSTGQTLLLWGGSSSVGASVIQLAVASGVEVIATASKKNFDMVKKLGATEVFDYNAPGVVGDLTEYLKDKKVAGGYDGESRLMYH